MILKTWVPSSKQILAWTSFLTGVLLAGVALAQPTPPPAPQAQTRNVIVTTDGADEATTSFSSGTGSSSGLAPAGTSSRLSLLSLTRPMKRPGKRPGWACPLRKRPRHSLRNLDLSPARDCWWIFVAPNSPAARAGIQKYNVIEELGDQTLVDPVQLRKLVQMQKDGDTDQIDTLSRREKARGVGHPGEAN